MTLDELEKLLGITVSDAQKPTYESRLAAALDHVNVDCGGQFSVTVDSVVTVTLPDGAKMGAALLVKAMGENQNVASQSLGDMAKSFFEGAGYKAARKYWSSYRKARFF